MRVLMLFSFLLIFSCAQPQTKLPEYSTVLTDKERDIQNQMFADSWLNTYIPFSEMGTDFISKYDWVKERYTISSEILGYDLLGAQSDPSLLNLTQYSQPMIFVFSSILIDLCKDFLHKNNIVPMVGGIIRF